MVLKLANVEPGLIPPVVVTTEGRWDAEGRTATLAARLDSLGDASSVQAGFEYRRKKDTAEMYEADDPWKALETTGQSDEGPFEARLSGADPSRDYEFRAVAEHPKMTFRGQVTTLERAR